MPSPQIRKLGRKSHRSLKNLLLGARDGNEVDVRWALKEDKVPVNAESSAGLTALFYAVRGQRYKATRLLMEKGADVNAPLPRQPSLLDLAEGLSDSKLVRILKEAGAESKPSVQLDEEQSTLPCWPTLINFKNTEYPLYEAAIAGDQEKFSDLANGLSQTRLKVLLVESCLEHETEFGKALIPCIKNIDFASEDSGNAISEAAGAGCLPLVEALCDAGAKKLLDVALLEAANGGHTDVVAYLIEPAMDYAGKRLRRQSDDVQEAFQNTFDGYAAFAAEQGYTRAAEILLPHCSAECASRIESAIQRWRAEHDEDTPPDRFAPYRGEDEEPPDDPSYTPDDLEADDATLNETVELAANVEAAVEDRVEALQTLARMGSNAASTVPTLNRLTQDPQKRIRRAVQKTLQAVRK